MKINEVTDNKSRIDEYGAILNLLSKAPKLFKHLKKKPSSQMKKTDFDEIPFKKEKFGKVHGDPKINKHERAKGKIQEDIDYDKAYRAFTSAEMGLRPAGDDGSGHFIRTFGANKKKDPEAYKKGSSAYGPTQLNVQTAKDFTSRHKDLFKGQDEYINKYKQQGGNFNKFGREPNKPGYDPKWEYGGKGDLSDPKYHPSYKNLSTGVMRGMMRDLKKKNPNANIDDLVKRWRGADKSHDPEYYDRFFKTYNQQ